MERHLPMSAALLHVLAAALAKPDPNDKSASSAVDSGNDWWCVVNADKLQSAEL
jgi:hypothetical protein